MSPLEQLAVVAAGFGAGVLTATVGVASLLSFPVLVALGLPPVTANASNTVGLVPAGLSGSWGYRHHLRRHPAMAAAVLATCAVGGVVGAVLLLALPAAVFEGVVPGLILLTCLLVGVQPRLSRWLRERRERRAGGAVADRTRMSAPTTAFATLTGVYGGYFGAGSGVMMMAVLGLGLDLDFRVVNALKTLAVLAGNVVATLVFVLVAPLEWRVVALLGVGSVVGGLVGARVGDRLPAPLLRGLIVVVGVAAAVALAL